jgi:predicted RNA binding protein YcfA (HicA-like mRNA interferase family)
MPLSSRDVMRIIMDDGWTKVAQKGSHMQFKHPTKPGKVTLPHPKATLHPKTVASILRQAGCKR